MTWNDELLEQLTWHWEHQLRPRLGGLTDEEYLWEPVRPSWNVHPRPDGPPTIDFEFPEPVPTPMTTIAWQFGHLLVGIFGARLATYFDGPPVDYFSYEYPTTAVDALARLDAAYAAWVAGVRSLGEDGLTVLCREEGFEQSTMAALVLHIHREVIHHGSVISTVRDLYAWRDRLNG
jgi:hypothetical protein